MVLVERSQVGIHEFVEFSWKFVCFEGFYVHLLMYIVITREEDWLVNISFLIPGVHRLLLSLVIAHKDYSFCVPRDRWDKDFFKLQSG